MIISQLDDDIPNDNSIYYSNMEKYNFQTTISYIYMFMV